MARPQPRKRVGGLSTYQALLAAVVTAVGGVIVAIITLNGNNGDTSSPIPSSSPTETSAGKAPAVAITSFQETPVPPPARHYAFVGTSTDLPDSWRVAVVGRPGSTSPTSAPKGTRVWQVSPFTDVDRKGEWKIDFRLDRAPSIAMEWVAIALEGGCPPPKQCQPAQSPDEVRADLERLGPAADQVKAKSPVSQSSSGT